MAMGRFCRFPLDLRRRTYDTRALPYECLMREVKYCGELLVLEVVSNVISFACML